MSEHTQGKEAWRAGKAEPHGTRVVTDTGGSVAWVPTVSSSEAAHCVSAEEAHRRAVLMAASEDLLAALRDAVSTLFMRIEERHGAKAASEYPEVVRGRAAIARATGGKT